MKLQFWVSYLFNFVQFSILSHFQFCPIFNFVDFSIFLSIFHFFNFLSNFQFCRFFNFVDFVQFLEFDRKKSRDLKEENVEFGIELLNKTEQNTKSIHFEALNMHDRKLWILKLRDAIGKYQEKSDQEKAKKYSGTFFFYVLFLNFVIKKKYIFCSVESSAMGRLLVIVEQAENLSTKNKGKKKFKVEGIFE